MHIIIKNRDRLIKMQKDIINQVHKKEGEYKDPKVRGRMKDMEHLVGEYKEYDDTSGRKLKFTYDPDKAEKPA